ncbi:MAG: dipeptidase PepE [Rhodothermia bacterium]|nr:dipeptidase PepE [Rhodothermia bacterium]
MGPDLLLLSNSTNHRQPYLGHAIPLIGSFLGPDVDTVAFVPYAGVTVDYDRYANLVAEKFAAAGFSVVSVHESRDPADVVRGADAIAVGGGNTFRLIERLYEFGLRKAIREEVLAGKPYIGWSAGSNVACPTIRTTNDMPIVEPPGFDALDLVPFQINPHYLDSHPEKHQGETREQRIMEFIELNPNTYVVGLREGSTMEVRGGKATLHGDKPCRVFVSGQEPREVGPDDNLTFLFRNDA